MEDRRGLLEVVGFVRSAPGALVRAVFPHFCVGCGDEGTVFCEKCLSETQPEAALSFSTAQIDGGLAMAKFNDRRLAGLLRMYKYEAIEEAGAALERIFRTWLRQHAGVLQALSQESLIVPVPLHWYRQAKRGFNQAERFARVLSQETGAPMKTTLLKRSFRLRAQATIADEKARLRNMRDTISVVFGCEVPKSIVLVDDVVTTGATIAACATALKKAGVKKVHSVALLRG